MVLLLKCNHMGFFLTLLGGLPFLLQPVMWYAHGAAVKTANSDMATLKNATCPPSSALWMTAKSRPSPAEQITPPLAQIPPKPSTAGAGKSPLLIKHQLL
jgi:hypothetical protein